MATPKPDPPDEHDPAAHAHPPDVVAALRRELADWRQWTARAVVLLFAALAGLAVVAFTRLTDFALQGFAWLRATEPWSPWLWTPVATAGLVWLGRRFAPGASGSGIPAVIAALEPQVTERDRGLFVSLRLSAWKAALTAGGLLAGLAIGREGPSVQIAAGVMHAARRWLPERSGVSAHGLMVAGGAAGIAAAFNAPLAGVMFAIEELSRRMEQRSSGLLIAAIVLAGLMGVSAFGNVTYFGVIRVPALDVGFLLPALLVTLSSGALGGVFARLLHASLAAPPGRLAHWRRSSPVAFAFGCGVAIAAIGWASQGATFGSGYDYTRGLLEGHAKPPLLYVTLRFVATWLASWSGVAGGLFAPALALGAGIGNDVAQLGGWQPVAAALIALGMAGFLAAVTQAPITAFIIVMEMVDGHAMVLSLMAAALGASLVSRLISRPLYPALAVLQLARLPAPDEAGGAQAPAAAQDPDEARAPD